MRAEREPMNEPPRETGAEGAPGKGAEDAGERAASRERQEGSAERRVRDEVAGIARETKERIADAIWERTASFAEHAATDGLGSRLSRFLEAFAALDDETLATDALRRARDEAARESRDPEAA